ncbi:translocation/assembly module TamB domain-containing protein [Aquimarina algicola]|uniref:Translocation/assembly module TamB n=1 Tax=Aquimarina algicola TaxID=2589995 RepID=A0A504J0X4_9FLAO|nr:translocation/assembly module TamB domain-containing protein [Aquimarina algicola]TPN84486.1 translocation/assembly module TamB [Aquimarina algicola]
MNKGSISNIKRKWIKRLLIILGSLLLLFVCSILFIRSRWGQEIIVNHTINYLRETTKTDIDIKQLYITFDGNIYLEGLYIEDQAKDTLLYSNTLEASVAIIPLIKGESFHLKSLNWSGAKANIYRKNITKNYNFQFLIDAFANEDSTIATKENSTFQIQLGDFDLSNIQVRFKDEIAGIDTSIFLGNLETQVETFNLEEMYFEIDKLSLANVDVQYDQNKPSISEKQTEEGILPKIRINAVEFENLKTTYTIPEDQLFSKIYIKDMTVASPNFNPETQKVSLESFVLKDSKVDFKNLKENLKDTDTVLKNKSANLQWPDWKVTSGDLQIINSDFRIQLSKTTPKINEFDPNHIQLNDITLRINKALLDEEQAILHLDRCTFKERSGINLYQFQTDLKATRQSFLVKDLHVKINDSKLSGRAKASFNNIQSLLDTPKNTNISLEVPDIKLSAEDILYFQSSLRENQYLQSISKKDITGQLFLTGTLDDFTVKKTDIHWGNNTKLAIEGKVQNILNINSTNISLQTIYAQTKRNDLINFIDEKDLSISLPDSITISGKAKGFLTDIKGNIELTSSFGDIQLNGSYQNTNQIVFDTELNVDNLLLNKLLKNNKLGKVSFIAKAEGNSTSIKTLNATFITDIKKLEFNGYDFSSLTLDGKLNNGAGRIKGNYKDDNLNLKLNSEIELDSVSPKFDISMQVIGADLNSLGITKKIIKTQFDLETTFQGNTETFDFDATIDNATVVHVQEPYSIDPIRFISHSDSTSTRFKIDSSFLKGDFSTNSKLNSALIAIQNQLKQYISEEEVSENKTDSIVVDANFTFQGVPVLSEVFIPELKDSDTLFLKAMFDSSKQKLFASLRAPLITYQDGKIDSLLLRFDGNHTKLDFTLDWNSIQFAPLMINKTKINGKVKDKKLYLNFDCFDTNGSIAQIQSELNFQKDSIYIHINPESLLLDRTPWSIKKSNQIILSSDDIYFDDFEIRKNKQAIVIRSDKPEIQKKHVHFDFTSFDLASLTSFLNPEEILANGLVNGFITIEDPLQNIGVSANLKINQLSIANTSLGDLMLEASNKGGSTYNLNIGVKGKNLDMSIKGSYLAQKEGSNVDMSLNLDRLEMTLIEEFTKSSISNLSGNLSGNARIQGTLNNPDYKGTFHFNKAAFLVNMLNTTFFLPEESIRFDNQGIYLDQFTIRDPEKHTFIVDGSINTEEFTNPAFNLTVRADNFTLINANQENNELFYGTVNASTNLTVAGDLKIPKIKGNLKVSENSNFTLVIPESELEIKEREGVVLFVNRENPNTILTRVEENQSQIAKIKGFDIETDLSVGKGSLFKIVIDKRTRDYIQVRGIGDFVFGMEPNGRIQLSGRYDITDGQYKVSLYNLVKREFNIAPNSFIKWNGDPLDAEMDIKAIYKVETNPSPIMISNNTNQYSRDLDFLVFLNVEGELLEPEISFAMDLPEDQQAFSGGDIYGRVQQLNKQESELNKQVFSLLVFNRFSALSGSNGSNGGPASIARDNVNKVLSSQLNNFSDKLIGKTGLELDFELDSYNTNTTDGTTTQTDLEINAQKKLFNDRLIVRVGSSVNVEGTNQADEGTTPVIGNVSLQYLIDENGKYRLVAFRKNEFESVIDGQLIVTGIGFIFNKEFNKFRELWSDTAKEIESQTKKPMIKKKKTTKNKN